MTNERTRTDQGDREQGDEHDFDRRTFLRGVGAAGAGLVVGAGTTGTAAAAEGSPVMDLVDGDTSIEQPTHTAVSSGRWADAGTWDAGVPGDDARVRIPSGVTVTLGSETARLHWLRVDGTYRVDTATDSHLRVDTFTSTEGATVEIGTAADSVAPDVTAETTFIDRGPIDEGWDPTRVSRGFLPMSRVSVHGAEKTEFTTLADDPTAGDAALELPEAPTNWQPSDSLVVPGVSARQNQDEEVTVESVSGSTVRIAETLQYDHVPPASDLDTYVLNLDRNVRFRSENTATKRRGHGMLMATGNDIANAGFYDMGRTDKNERFSNPDYGGSELELPENANVKARYALHFHKTGPFRDVTPHEVTGCVVAPRTDGAGESGSPGWGFTNHQSYGHVTDSIAYRVFGAGFMTETGVEVGSFEHNFALRTEGSGRDPDWREFIENFNRERNIDDYGHNGVGFWLQGPLVTVKNNVAAGHRNHGFAYWNRALGDFVPDPLPYDDPAEKEPPADDMTEAELGRHRGNVPNVPAREALNKPTEEHNVAPDTAGPGVDEFAHAVYEAADGTTYVDEGSIPIHNVGNTVFASGSGIDVMNHMRGADNDIVGGREEYYGRIEDFTAWNIHGRSGEDELPATNLDGFGGVRGVNLGIGFRYSKFIKVENARLIGEGDGVGISHNMRMDGLVVENSSVENFQDGIGALNPGKTTVRNTAIDTADSGVYISGESVFGGESAVELTNVDGNDNEVWMEPDSASFEKSDWALDLTLDGADLYYEIQDPAHVLTPDQATYDDYGGYDTFGVAYGDMAGKTVQQLADQYGIRPYGQLAPSSATTDPMVHGGLVDGDTSTDTAPTVSITSAPETATVGESVTFEAAGSDQDGGSVTYAWEGPAGTDTGSTYTTAFEAAGEATVIVTVTDDEGQTATASTTVSVEDDTTGSSVEAAINCGDAAGHTTSEGVTFVADGYYTGGASDSADRSIANTDEDGLYDSNRWGNYMEYDVPVSDASATYDVRLHFAETYWSSAGARVFDVLVEGTTGLSGFDPYAAAGGKNIAVSRTVSGVTPTDGSVTVSFEGIADNALLSGIEMVQSGSNTTAPTASITSAPETATVGESVTVEATGSDQDGGSVTFDWAGPTGSGTGSTYTTAFDTAGEATVTVTVTDDEGQTATASTTVAVDAASGSVEAAINCGDSSSHTTSEGVTFAADDHFSGGAADAADRAIANTDEDGLYDSNRWGNDTVYDVPVSDSSATYDVTLHFAETYWSSAGARVFDVLIEGTTELSGFDPYAAAGGKNTAVSRTVTGVTPTDGAVTISFGGISDNALVSGIEIVQSGSDGDTTAPSAPSNLVSTGKTGSAVDLSWDAASDSGTGLSHYNVYVDGTKDQQVSAGTTAATVSGLADDTTYDVSVAAVDGAGNESSDAGPLSVTTVDETAPAAPTNLAATGTSSTSVDLSWDASTSSDVASYAVYEGGASTKTGVASTSTTISGLSANTTYDVTVRAVDDAGNESGDSNTLSVTTDGPTPSKLDESGWTATALLGNVSDAAEAFDGDDTRWTSGTAISSAQSRLLIDFGGSQTLDTVTIEHYGSDYPSSLDVELYDGTAWTTVASPSLSSASTTVSFASQSATKLRLVETDDATSSWWSLLDVSAADGATALDESGWTATGLVRQTQDATEALDGERDSTAWSSGVALGDREMAITVDLGGSSTLTQVGVTHSGSDHPATMDIDVFDGSAWVTVASGVSVSSGTTSVDIADQSGSRLRLTETDGSKSNWWAVTDVSVQGY